MQIKRAEVDPAKFNPDARLPHELRTVDFEMAMRDVYDFFHDVNGYLLGKGLDRLDDMLRPANCSGTLSDMLTDALAKHSRTLIVNRYPNGHPDLVVRGRYPNDSVRAGEHGMEVKSTRKAGGAVDMHGARDQDLCVFVYEVDNDRGKPAHEREPLSIREIYVSTVVAAEFRLNARGPLGTRTATLGRAGIRRLRESWVYLDRAPSGPGWRAETLL